MGSHSPSPAYMRVPTLAQGGTRSDNSAWVLVDNLIIMLTPTAAQEEKIRKTPLNQINDSEEEEKWLLDALAETTNGILTFVCLKSLVHLFID